MQILIRRGSKLYPDQTKDSDRSESCNNCMHQYLGLPQIRPTAATCNYKTPTEPRSEETPKSFVSPTPLFDASLSAINPTVLLLTYFPEQLKKQGKSYYPAPSVQNMHNVPTATAVATSVQTTSLYSSTEKAQYPNSPKPWLPQTKLPFSAFLGSPSQFSVKVQGGKSTKDEHYCCLYVNMVKNDISCLVIK